jgi:SET domain-containing protein
MYKPLPNCLTIKKSPIEGLGLFATSNIKANSFIGLTHIQDNDFENSYIRTPLGGFYNHSNDPTVMRMVSDALPRLKFGDIIDPNMAGKKIKDGKTDRENMYYNLQDKIDAKFMFIVTVKDVKAGDELTANYNLYTYPKTGVGLQMI